MRTILRRQGSLLLCLALLLGLLTVSASAATQPGVYTGTVTTNYHNPDTGKIDDPGEDETGLGEGMCRSATGTTALVEVDAAGNTWLTIRLLLQSNCSNVALYTRTGYNTYEKVDYTVISEDSGNDSIDYRFQVSEAGVMLKGTMYVAPMGRDVLWYLSVDPDSLTAGSGDFEVTIDPNQPAPVDPTPVDPTPVDPTPGVLDAFTDVSSHWAKDYIEVAVERGLFSGTSSTTFSPDTSMTRGMFVTVLGRLAGVSATNGQTQFADVAANAYYAPYVAWAAENGIVYGTSTTTFSPETAINRQEMAVLLSRYCGFAGITLEQGQKVTFSDQAKIDSFAAEAVQDMAAAGLLTGSNGAFNPKSTATRAEVATVLARFIQGYGL